MTELVGLNKKPAKNTREINGLLTELGKRIKDAEEMEETYLTRMPIRYSSDF